MWRVLKWLGNLSDHTDSNPTSSFDFGPARFVLCDERNLNCVKSLMIAGVHIFSDVGTLVCFAQCLHICFNTKTSPNKPQEFKLYFVF